jgi:hypothetical protein
MQAYINRQETSQVQKNQETEKLIANSPDLSSAVDSIIQQNIFTGISNNGAGDFYDINLMYHVDPNSQDNYDSGMPEPDGFRLFLIKPNTLNVEGLLKATGKFVETGADYLGKGADAVAGFVKPVTDATSITTPFGNSSDMINNLGAGTKQLGKSINSYLANEGEQFTESVNQYTRNAYDQHAGTANAYYSAILPMPKNLTDQHSHEVDQLMLGVMPRVLTALGAGFSGDSKGFKNAGARRSGGGVVPELASAVGGGIGKALATGALEFGAYAYQTAKARAKVGLNPNVEAIYSAPRMRNWTFNFELYPKSATEVGNVRDFIQRLKQHSYPISVLGIAGQNQLYAYPGEVYFEFSGRYKDKLFKSLRPCIITNIQVDYSNGDQYQHFQDGSSIVYTITLELQETRLLDRNILVDDAKQPGKSFANEDYRNTIKNNNTFAQEEITKFLTRENTPEENNRTPPFLRP